MAPLAPGRRWEMRRTRKHLEEMAQAARALALYAEELHALLSERPLEALRPRGQAPGPPRSAKPPCGQPGRRFFGGFVMGRTC